MAAPSFVENKVLGSHVSDVEMTKDAAALKMTEAELQSADSKEKLEQRFELEKDLTVSNALTNFDAVGTGQNEESLEKLQKLAKDFTLLLGGASLNQKAVITDKIKILNDKIDKFEATSHRGVEKKENQVVYDDVTFQQSEEDEKKKKPLKKNYELCTLEELQEESLALLAELIRLGAKSFEMLGEYLRDDDGNEIVTEYEPMIAVDVENLEQFNAFQDLVAVNRERDEHLGISESKEIKDRDGNVTARLTTTLDAKGFQGETDPNKMTEEDVKNLLTFVKNNPDSITFKVSGIGDEDQLHDLARENALESKTAFIDSIKNRFSDIFQDEQRESTTEGLTESMRNALEESLAFIRNGKRLLNMQLQEVDGQDVMPSAPPFEAQRVNDEQKNMPIVEMGGKDTVPLAPPLEVSVQAHPVVQAVPLEQGNEELIWADEAQRVSDNQEDIPMVEAVPIAENDATHDNQSAAMRDSARVIDVLAKGMSQDSDKTVELHVNNISQGKSGQGDGSQGR